MTEGPTFNGTRMVEIPLDVAQSMRDHIIADHAILKTIWKLHRPGEYGGKAECTLDLEGWPCSTIRAFGGTVD